jgi:6-phosphogluconolactonase
VTVRIEVMADPARTCTAMMLTAAIGGGDIVLTGGSTPRAAYERFASEATAIGLDLSRTTLWLGDERCVAPDDERSNYRMIKESMLDPLAGATAPVMHRIRGELGPDAGAADYARTLAYHGPPRFDLLLLGIGSDGHCASLFPGQDTLAQRCGLMVGCEQAGLEPFVPRVSMTFTAIALARHIVVLASGASKAEPIARAFGPDAVPDPEVPSSLLAPAAGPITVLCDPAAAAGLAAATEGGAR